MKLTSLCAEAIKLLRAMVKKKSREDRKGLQEWVWVSGYTILNRTGEASSRQREYKMRWF